MASSDSESSACWTATRTDRKSGALSPEAPPAAERRSSALQSEIRSMIAQTEQLLSTALSHESPQRRSPQPPRTAAVSTGTIPLPLTWLAAPDTIRFEVATASDSSGNSSSASVASGERNETETENELSDGEVDAPARAVVTERQGLTQQQQPHRLTGRVQSALDRELVEEANDVDDELDNQAEEEREDDDDDDGGDDGALQQQQFLPSALTTRDINASKARALQESMLGNLVRLGFRENLARLALDAGAQEIEHYDADCELAYVDIFVSLVKMVCDAHLDAFSHRPPAPPHQAGGASASQSSAASWASAASDGARYANSDWTGSDGPPHTMPAVPFKWPVFDMAQFEFGNARTGTCFDSVCVLTNLPKVATDRTEELMEVLSCNLFCMLGDPIQVVIPSVSATGRTKGHAFLEFDDPVMARRCAAAVDGLAWGRGPFGRIRSSMFREYQVKSPTVPQLQSDGFRGEAAGAQSALDAFTSSSTSAHNGSAYQVTPRFSDAVARGGVLSPVGRNATQLFPRESVGDRDGGAIDARFPPMHSMDGQTLYRFPDSVYTSSEDEEDEDDDDDDDDENDDDILWQTQELNRHPFLADVRSALPQPLSIDEVGVDDFDDPNVVLHRPAFSHRTQLPDYGFADVGDSQHLSSDGEDNEDDDEDDDDNDVGFGFVDTDADDSWEYNNMLEVQSSGARHQTSESAHWGPSDPHCGSAHASLWQPPPPPPAAATEKAVAGAAVTSAYSPRVPREWSPRRAQTSESAKPWRSYCEELIARNREMQEQVAFARRRIVQLGHNNQKLHLLVDRVERDRDGLVFENDVLQSQLKGLEDHERHREALLDELAALRKRLRKKEQRGSVSGRPSTSTTTSLDDLRFVLQHELGASALAGKGLEELRQWEALLESSLARVRGSREEKALALQKKLDRQVEEQQELKLCVICLASEKSILCLPCRHLCLCEACSAREEVENCPICRLRIDEMLLVYA
ncbi:hypothetical protein PybrP1_011098 [[Pythium] brassicae (nom. inval.)]|nr:hypothetical protein PybrP1_011098 [[Pythium] brassicae (nom. inval.)]